MVKRVNKLWRVKGGVKIYLTLRSIFTEHILDEEHMIKFMLQRPDKYDFVKVDEEMKEREFSYEKTFILNLN